MKSQACNVMGIDNVAFLYIRVEKPSEIGDIFNVNDKEYEVYKADPVTRNNQLQNVYVKEIETN